MWKTVDYRFKELKHLRVVEKLAAWRKSNGFDLCDVHDRQWFHSLLPPTSEETTASLWADVNALKKEISMSEKDRSKQRMEKFLNEIESCTRQVRTHHHEERPRCGACGVALVGTAQPSNI